MDLTEPQIALLAVLQRADPEIDRLRGHRLTQPADPDKAARYIRRRIALYEDPREGEA